MILSFYKPEDDPKGLKHVATLIVYNITLHHILCKTDNKQNFYKTVRFVLVKCSNVAESY